jgi:hypothetical protein
MPANLATWEAEIRKSWFEDCQGKQFSRPQFQTNQSKRDWKYGTKSRRVIALQAQTPVSPKKKKKNILKFIGLLGRSSIT